MTARAVLIYLGTKEPSVTLVSAQWEISQTEQLVY